LPLVFLLVGAVPAVAQQPTLNQQFAECNKHHAEFPNSKNHAIDGKHYVAGWQKCEAIGQQWLDRNNQDAIPFAAISKARRIRPDMK
jgi:hypothetical protein